MAFGLVLVLEDPREVKTLVNSSLRKCVTEEECIATNISISSAGLLLILLLAILIRLLVLRLV